LSIFTRKNTLELFIIITILTLTALFYLLKYIKNESWKTPSESLDKASKSILISNIKFYSNLSESNQKHFEYKVQEFLLNVSIIGVDTKITEEDKLLIASSAIIPIFAFKNWKYRNLNQIIIYPSHFNLDFKTTGPLRNIKGLVGTGYMEGKMLLSKTALHHGFSNETDKRNTALHEFIHLIDKADGVVDGIPKILLEEPNQIPWLEYIYKQIGLIKTKQSDIHAYGATNEMEFFSVASEYFFERPKLLKKKHPELYSKLEHIFKQDMINRW